MKFEKYIERRFTAATQAVIDQALEIITEYAKQGYDLTLRQLYYQFVARDLIPNEQREYNRLGSIVNDARLAGELPWDVMVDRTRFIRANSHWANPVDIMHSAASSFQLDKWLRQKNRVEVWIEKDALIGAIEQVCRDNDVPHFSCRGYTSQSEMWTASKRLRRYRDQGQRTIILHLGDHDPSGMDMSRDIDDRLTLFLGDRMLDVTRIALNMDQVEQYNPPPNPAKITDSRAAGYIDRFGESSWELDALNPATLSSVIQSYIDRFRDADLWDDALERETEHRRLLDAAADQWDEITEDL